MTTLITPARNAEPSALADAITRLGEEAATLALALLDPNPILEEVQQMHALQVEANRIEAADPARASSLRERASRIGLGPCAMNRGEAKAPE